jgi:tRNA threonylcarbamoyladenosine biosynthesis protein TsaE
MNLSLANDAETQSVGHALGRALALNLAFVSLAGELGAGKTTLVRAALRALGHTGPVRSPTYTLIETYALPNGSFHHLDWYRLGDAEELESLGFRDLLQPGHAVLVEWPERIPSVAQQADLVIEIDYAGDGRALRARARTARGEGLLRAWNTEIA